jgi:hypothetical protein
MKPVIHKTANVAYKAFYTVLLVLLVFVLLGDAYEWIRVSPSQAIPMALCAFVGAFVLLATVAPRRVPLWQHCVGTLLLCGLFTWFAWYSFDGFLVMREGHTFDPLGAAMESKQFYRDSVIEYTLIMAWFLSLPVVRAISARRARGSRVPR